MKRSLLLVSFVAALFLAGSVWAAVPKQTGAQTGNLTMQGTIVSSSSSELVLSAKVKGKTEQETFVLNPQTKAMGDLAAGSVAVIHYKNDNGQKVATSINVHKAKQAKAK
jgi:hypothetical protein